MCGKFVVRVCVRVCAALIHQWRTGSSLSTHTCSNCVFGWSCCQWSEGDYVDVDSQGSGWKDDGYDGDSGGGRRYEEGS